MTNFLLETGGHGHDHGALSHFLHEHLGRFGEFLDEVVLHGLIDTLKIVLFLFLTYMLLEFIEQRAQDETVSLMRKAGRFGPALGGVLGVIPQCGFSTVAANLYTGGIIGLGTVIAVFLSTSDEMLVVLLSGNVKVSSVLLIVGYKTLAGILAGFFIDFCLRMAGKRTTLKPMKKGCKPCLDIADRDFVKEEADGGGEHHGDESHEHSAVDIPDHSGHGDHEGHSHAKGSIFKCALRHTLSVGVYILLVTVVLNALMFFIGEEAISKIMVDIPVVSHLIAAFIGLIPNCAVSVALTEFAVSGLISEGVMLSGLLSGAGVGLLVLIRTNKDPKEDILVPAILVVAGTLFGFIADLLPFISIF